MTYANATIYDFFVLGTVNGRVYTFHIQIGELGPSAQSYSGPGTYTTNTLVGLGVGDYKSHPNLPTWTAATTGMVTVNGGGKGGSVEALLNSNEQTSGTVQVTGTWSCTTLHHL